MNKIVFEEYEVEYIFKKNLKHTYISVDKNSKITIKTSNTSKIFIQNLLLEKELWIKKQLINLKTNKCKDINFGNEVLLFGNIINMDNDEVVYLREKLQKLRNSSYENILRCYEDFYKHIALLYLPQKVNYFATLMNLTIKELKFKKLKSRWGSCNSLGVITLNSELLKVRKELIDYVIVHELAHLIYMNHSKKFHTLVDFYLPNSKLLRKELKKIIL